MTTNITTFSLWTKGQIYVKRNDQELFVLNVVLSIISS